MPSINITAITGKRYIENNPGLWKKYFPWKKTSSHKYSRGRVIVYGGQKELTGASILSSLAALRTGVGSVKILCSKNVTLLEVGVPTFLASWGRPFTISNTRILSGLVYLDF